MRNHHSCPKCRGRRIWKIEQLETKDPGSDTSRGDPIMLAVGRTTPATREPSTWKGDGSTTYNAGVVDAWVCAGCGYTELWSRGLESLVHNPDNGVYLIDATALDTEYR